MWIQYRPRGDHGARTEVNIGQLLPVPARDLLECLGPLPPSSLEHVHPQQGGNQGPVLSVPVRVSAALAGSAWQRGKQLEKSLPKGECFNPFHK